MKEGRHACIGAVGATNWQRFLVLPIVDGGGYGDQEKLFFRQQQKRRSKGIACGSTRGGCIEVSISRLDATLTKATWHATLNFLERLRFGGSRTAPIFSIFVMRLRHKFGVIDFLVAAVPLSSLECWTIQCHILYVDCYHLGGAIASDNDESIKIEKSLQIYD